MCADDLRERRRGCIRLHAELDHVVAVEQARIAFEHDREVAPIVEAEPGAAIRQRVSIQTGRGIERQSNPVLHVKCRSTPPPGR